MTDKNQIRTRLADTLQALSPFYRESVTKHLQESGAPNNWFVLSSVRGLDPEPISVEQAHQLAPYSSTERQMEMLEELSQEGFLIQADDKFTLSDKGRNVIEGFFNNAHEDLREAKPLSTKEMDRLANLLGRLVQATIISEEPAEKPTLLRSGWTAPAKDDSKAAWIDQYVTDLLQYRDDAHIASWKPHGISGNLWETLTFVWREEANTAELLAERLSFRGYDVDAFSSALSSLADRGWVKEADGIYKVTAEGKKIREEAEVETDRLNYLSWKVLDDDELNQLDDLLARANEKLAVAGRDMLWPLVGEVSGAVYAVAGDVAAPLIEKYFEKPTAFFPTLLAIGVAPEPCNTADYVRRSPYMNPEQVAVRFADATSIGLLQDLSGGQAFKVTEKGEQAYTTVNDVFYSHLGQVEALPVEDLERLAGLLEKIVKASLKAEQPVGKWALNNSHRCHPDKEYAPLALVDQYLDDLRAFRDDAHIAAWEIHGISGPAWEALTFIWREEASSAAELAEKLPFRGYGAEDYDGFLSELAEKGWAKSTPEGYRVTETGMEIRQEAEKATNNYFFGPWESLDTREQNQLRLLLIRLKLGLQQLIKE